MKRWFTGKMALILAAVLLMTVWVPALAAEGGSQKLTTYYSLAVGYIGKEDYGKAMEYLEAALAICQEETDPDMCADLHLKKGCVHTIRKEYDDALKELDEALRISPELAEAYLVRVQIYTETENRDEAITNLEQYIALSGDVSLNETLAELYLAREDRQKAAESYRKIAETTSDDPAEVTYNLAMYEMNAEMYAEALENLNQLTADPVKAPGLYYNSGVCNMLLGNYETAAENFTASLENETYQLDAAYNRAICRMALQNYLEAIDDFTTYIDGMLAAAAQPRPETAEPAAEESAEAPAAETAEQPEGEAAAEAAEPADAEADTAETALSNEVAAAVDIAYYYRGICYLSVNEFDNAAADLSICIGHGLNVNESTFNRGVCYLQSGMLEEARTDFTACIDQEYMADSALFYRAYVFRLLEDNESALRDLTVCVEHGYDLGQTYQQRAAIYQAMGEDDLYLQDLEASLEYLDE